MGLGPPVCINCELILNFEPNFEVKNCEPWYCKTCGELPQINTSHLWCYPRDKIIEIEKKSYGSSLHEEWIAKGIKK